MRVRRSLLVKDVTAVAGLVRRPKADASNAGQVGAPMKADVVEVKVAVGDEVEKGQVVAVLSAMKMEMAVQAATSGVVRQVLVAKGDKVDAEDYMVEIE